MTELVDIFDAGPTLECPVAKLGAVQRCRESTVCSIEKQIDSPSQIISTMMGGFAAVLAPCLKTREGTLHIETATALALGVKVGDRIWTLSPHPETEPIES